MTGSQDDGERVKGPPWPTLGKERFAALKAKVEAYRAEQRHLSEQQPDRPDGDQRDE